ncbi:hypothetical protein ABTH20_21510, partial [Acinetobacter baumannii]
MTRITRNTCLFLLIAFSLLLAGVAGLARLNQKEVRDSLALEIKESALAWAIASCNEQEIDELNILHASMLAMRRAVEA